VRITVLGKSPAWQDADGACSGYLVEGGGQRVLLDCGPGVFAKLRRFADYAEVDAVVISHLHADHVLDLVPFASGLRYGPRRHPARPRLLAPPGAREQLAALCTATCMSAEHIETAFDLTVYDPAETHALGELTVRFTPVPHFVPCNAVEFREHGCRFTFSADCGPNDALCEFARDTGLLLIEATLPCPEPEGDRGHLTPAEAGEHGARARAQRLVLTHISDELDPRWARAEAERGYGGRVEIAAEGAVYEIKL
jgi:ribonuclease BN (tRNA processing enzyme)